MEFAGRASAQLHEWYRSLTPGGRLTAGLLAAVIVLGLAYAGTQRTAAPEVDLMRGVPVAAPHLPPMEAAFAKANLTGYEVRGNSIFVPKGQEAAYMAALVKEKALPSNFDEQPDLAGDGSFIETGPQREDRNKRAKQRDLSLAIGAMPGIERARVFYDVDNRPGPFKEKLITATIIVKPAGTSQLEESRVLDIRNLVAGAIAGLKPENVTVSDLNGRTWRGDWHKQNPGAPNAGSETATVTRTDHRQMEEAAKPKPASEPAAADFAHDAWQWAAQSWRTLAVIGATLLGMLLLRSMVRRPANVAKAPVSSAETAANDATAVAGTGKVPPPHWRRKSGIDVTNLREELSALVQDDPETAARILRKWIGQVS
jgi:flagellar biosynthesis/type III secretory pathway M-ring protein FliF/YscJ